MFDIHCHMLNNLFIRVQLYCSQICDPARELGQMSVSILEEPGTVDVEDVQA